MRRRAAHVQVVDRRSIPCPPRNRTEEQQLFEGKLALTDREHEADVLAGACAIALRRASMFGRAPVVHDLTIAFTIWGFYDQSPPPELLELRREKFEGLRLVGHHYAEARAVVDMVPEATLRMTPGAVTAAYPGEWRSLLGV